MFQASMRVIIERIALSKRLSQAVLDFIELLLYISSCGLVRSLFEFSYGSLLTIHVRIIIVVKVCKDTYKTKIFSTI